MEEPAKTPTKTHPLPWPSPSPSSKRAKQSICYSDRFIPSRSVSARLDFSVLDREMALDETNKALSEREEANSSYEHVIRSGLLGTSSLRTAPANSLEAGPSNTAMTSNGRLIRYISGDAQSPMAGPPPQSPFSRSLLEDSTSAFSPFASSPMKAAQRKINKAPSKVLDAPGLQDDFYLNLVDWSSQNVLAVGLGRSVYLWSAATSSVTKLCDLPSENDSVASVSWSQRGSYLSVGSHTGKVHLWDVNKMKAMRVMEGHKSRVGAQSWSSHLLSSGSRDKTILNRDVRAREPFVSRLNAHRSEVCGLRWSPDSTQLASGGNDNVLCVWSPQHNRTSPVHCFTQHVAAVKAIAWSPHQHGLLASGGGTADRCIKFWNTGPGTLINSIDTGSQVCNLVWSKNVNEIVSTHGYSQNAVCVWRYPSMSKLATLTGHSLRVLYLAASPDGQMVVTGAGDETLRFWSLFPSATTTAASKGNENTPSKINSRNTIR